MIYRPRFDAVEVSAPVDFSGAQYVMMAAGGHVHALPMDVIDVLFTCIVPDNAPELKELRAESQKAARNIPKNIPASNANGKPAAKPARNNISKLQLQRRDEVRAALLAVVREAALTTAEVWDHAKRWRPTLTRMEAAANLAAMAKDGFVVQRECPETRLAKWFEVRR